MYKNKSNKPLLRIGLSRSEKPSTISPIRITPVPGVKSRTLGISRSYKAPKYIENLVKSPILTNPIINNIPEKITSSVRKMRNNKDKSSILMKKHDARCEDADKTKENANIATQLENVIIPAEGETSYSPMEDRKSAMNKRPKQNIDTVTEKIPNTPNNIENQDASISYSPLDIQESVSNEEVQMTKVLKVRRFTVESPRSTPKTITKVFENKLSIISNNSSTSSLKLHKCSRLSLKKSRTIELSDQSDDEIKPFKKAAKLKHFESNTSIGSNMSDCSVILDRLSNEIMKTYEENNVDQNENDLQHQEIVTEFIDLSQGSKEDVNRKALCDKIILMEQILKSKRIDLDALKQSIIYKKKHSIEELNSVTDVWKNGCKLALSDLLLKIQEVMESNMTMDGLLKQLNVPENILKYNPETNELI